MVLRLVIPLMLLATSAMAGTLDRARSNAKHGSSKSRSHAPSKAPRQTGGSRHGATHHHHQTETSGEDVDLAAQLFWDTVRFPLVIPQLLLESHGPLPFVYEGHPYAHDGKGIIRTQPYVDTASAAVPSVLPAPEVDSYARADSSELNENNWMPGDVIREAPAPTPAPAQALPPAETGTLYATDDPRAASPYAYQLPPNPLLESWDAGGHHWAFQLQGDLALIDGNTYRVRPRVRLFTPTRFELDAECAVYRERLEGDDAQALGRSVDWLTLSALHVAARFAQSQAVNFRLGVGAKMLASGDGVQLGPDAVYGVDIFPHRPVIISASVGAGWIGKAFSYDLRVSVGIAVSAVEFLVGAERLAIGDAVLSGPVGGIRLWF